MSNPNKSPKWMHTLSPGGENEGFFSVKGYISSGLFLT